MPGLIATDLKKSFPTSGDDVVVLQDASLTLEAGENVAILGPSGSGKSTLLAILGTLDRPNSGSLSLEDINPFSLDQRELAAFRNRKIGFVFQDHLLLPQCTVMENVLVPLLADGSASGDDIERAMLLLDRIGLADRASHRPAQLSGGERQRTALARALIRDPLLILADEPTGNLDRTTASSVAELMLELQQERNAILVVVTHSEPLAEKLQQRLEIDSGRLIQAA
jgi:lipoprotein-releasing system ATP-binding protein